MGPPHLVERGEGSTIQVGSSPDMRGMRKIKVDVFYRYEDTNKGSPGGGGEVFNYLYEINSRSSWLNGAELIVWSSTFCRGVSSNLTRNRRVSVSYWLLQSDDPWQVLRLIDINFSLTTSCTMMALSVLLG